MPSEVPGGAATVRGASPGRVAYVLKMYPRFSETFVVSEILAREALGEQIVIFSLRPPNDPRFHPELSRVKAPVIYIDRPAKSSTVWSALAAAVRAEPRIGDAMAGSLGELLDSTVDDAVQAVLVARAALEHGVDHLHAHFASLATTVARLASRLAGIPYSFTAHAKDLFHESSEAADVAVKLRDAHHVVTVSDYNLRFLRDAHPQHTGRVHRVYNGLELARFPFRAPPSAGGRLRVGAVGRLVEKKGFGLLLEACAALTARGLAIDVRIAGGGELAGPLAESVRRLGLGSTVTLLGPLPQNEILQLLADSDVFVAPSVVAADGNADGLPTTILEAMAIGVPCIAGDVTGIPEIIRHGDTGLLCRSGRLDDLVEAMQLVADPGFDRAGMAGRARELVERDFDSERLARALSGLRRTAAPVGIL